MLVIEEICFENQIFCVYLQSEGDGRPKRGFLFY